MDPKMCFFGLFRAKMTKIGIQNPKLIVTNDYQQFLAHFDWFLSIFQISDVKPELLPAELQRIVKMDRIPNIFVFENLMHTEYRIIRFLKIDRIRIVVFGLNYSNTEY